MEMLRVHFNNHYRSDHQYFRKSDKDAFVFTVAFQSISKRTTNQFREFLRKMLPWNLAPVNNQIIPENLLQKVFIVHVLLEINVLRIFTGTIFIIEKFAIIVDD